MRDIAIQPRMSRKRSKELAREWGFELWYDDQIQLWTLQRNGYVEIEAPGGAYIAPRVLDAMWPHQFVECYLHVDNYFAFTRIQTLPEAPL